VDSSSSYTFSSWRDRIPTWHQFIHGGHVYTSLERKLLAFALIIFIGSLIWTVVNQVNLSIVKNPVPGGTYSEGLIGQPQYINPVFATTSAVDTDLTRLVFSGLLRYDKNLDLQPDLAESIEISDDRLQYTVHMRSNLAWHDGTPLTAHDVKFTYDNIRNLEVGSPLESTFRNVVVETIDDSTLRISLSKPYSPFLHILTVGIIPQHIWDSIPRNQWKDSDFNLRPIGNGPWEFSTFKKDGQGNISSYTLRKNKYSHRQPNIEKIIFSFFKTEEAALSAFKARSIQGFAFGFGSTPSNQDIQSGVSYTELTTPATTGIFFNLSKTSPLEIKRVRQALQLAINHRDLTLDVLNGQVAPLYHALPKQLIPSDFKLSTIKSDKNAAEDLLNRAGWERIGAIRKNDDDETLSIELTVIDREPDKAVARSIQQDWQDIGVDAKLRLIRPVTAENIQHSILQERQYDALLFTTVYGATIDLYPFWHSSQRVYPGLNLAQLSDQNLDEIVTNLRIAPTDAERNSLLENALQEIDDLVPAVFLYSPQLVYAQSDKIRGMMNTRIAIPADRFNDIESWYVKNDYKLIRNE
jgi:peptide/nickel transport system substrate-binding protein